MLVVRERDDDAFDVEQSDDRRQAFSAAEQREVLEIVPAFLRAVVDEADEVNAVFRVREELPRDELADVARSDDDSVLEVADLATADRTTERPRR